jgi:hypothetical protein
MQKAHKEGRERMVTLSERVNVLVDMVNWCLKYEGRSCERGAQSNLTYLQISVPSTLVFGDYLSFNRSPIIFFEKGVQVKLL